MKKSALIFVCSVILLMLGQLTNCYRAAPTVFFERGLLTNGDGFFIGKLAVSEQQGIFKNIGAVAQIMPDTTVVTLTDEEKLNHRRSFYTSYSKDAYYQKTPLENVTIQYYFSKIAIHSFFYNLGNWLFHPDPYSYIDYLKFQKSLLFSLVLAWIITWTVSLTNIWTGIILLVSFICSPIMTLMARTLYFAPFAFYIPFIVATYLLHQAYLGKIQFGLKQYLLLSLSFLFHMCFHSFEYISTMGITAVTPFVFYGLLEGIDLKSIFIRMAKASMVYFVAILMGTMLLIIQNNVATKTSFVEGLERIWERYEMRGKGEDITLEQIAAETNPNRINNLQKRYDAKNISQWSVINLFVQDKAIAVFGGSQAVFGLKYLAYLILFGLSMLTILARVVLMKGSEDHKLSLSLVVTTLFSFLAPVSWWVMFKPHSYHHSHFVVFVWMLPFTIFGFMLVGHTITLLSHKFARK